MRETEASLELLRRAGAGVEPGAAPEVPRALAAVQAGDTLAAIRLARTAVARHALDAGAHALLADLLLSRSPDDIEGSIEAYAARALVPEQPYVWRRWAMVQAHRERYNEALVSFRRYFALAGANGEGDREARRWLDTITETLPRGSVAVEGPRR